MRLACGFLALFAVLGARPTIARAQTGPAVNCSGMSLTAQLGLAVGDCASANPKNCNVVSTAAANSVLDEAECLCNSTDLYVYIKVTMPFSTQPSDALQVWVGSGCDQTVNRQTTTTACEQVKNSTLTTANFTAGAGGPIYQYIPVQALLSPTMHGVCSGAPSNALWLLFLSGSSTADAVCSITFQAQLQPPQAPTSLTAGSGDSAVTLNWQAPPVGTIRPTHYQVLCADATGNDTGRSGQFIQGYSTCTADHGLERRPPSIGGSIGVGTGDGGTTIPIGDGGTGTMSTTSAGPSSEHLGTEAAPSDDSGTIADDSGTLTDASGTGPVDMTPVTNNVGPAPFNYLDKRFICSNVLDGTVSQLRITGLNNGTQYQFVVVGIDDSGNPSPSGLTVATPQAVDDLYRRFREEGGAKQGFCFIATAAYGSYESPYVQVLRRFRDEVLLPTEPGRAFVDWYYQFSPPVALFIVAHPTARWVVRTALWPVIGLAALWLEIGGGWMLCLFTLVLAFAYRRRLRRVWSAPARSAV